MSHRRTMAAIAMLLAATPRLAQAETRIEDDGGIRYQVSQQLVPQQIPVTETREQQQTTYRQQVTTETLQHQQVYSVPVTQYQLVSRLHGRWNPLVTPYWTHHYEPVTTWQQQVATVQIPVSRVAWAPETRTVQVPVTTYRTVNAEINHRVPIGPTPVTAMASRPLSGTSQPSATLAARPSASSAAPTPIGGQMLEADPPRQATGWQQQSPRYK